MLDGDAGVGAVPFAVALELAQPGTQQQAGCCTEHCGSNEKGESGMGGKVRGVIFVMSLEKQKA